MKKLNPKAKIALLVLALLLTNLLTGMLVYRTKEKEYNNLKAKIQTTIDQKLAIQEDLEALQLICPTETIEE